MPSIQFQLDAPLARVEAHVRATYGTAARVVSVREVRTGGIGGFFAHRSLDIVVDVPDPVPGPPFGNGAAGEGVPGARARNGRGGRRGRTTRERRPDGRVGDVHDDVAGPGGEEPAHPAGAELAHPGDARRGPGRRPHVPFDTGEGGANLGSD